MCSQSCTHGRTCVHYTETMLQRFCPKLLQLDIRMLEAISGEKITGFLFCVACLPQFKLESGDARWK